MNMLEKRIKRVVDEFENLKGRRPTVQVVFSFSFENEYDTLFSFINRNWSGRE